MVNPIGPIVAADEGFHHQVADTFAVVGPSDPGVDREGLRDGDGARRLDPARLRDGQVHEPQRARRVRRGVAGQGAVDGAREPRARDRSRAHDRRADPLRGARADARRAVRARRERRAAGRVRVDVRGRAADRRSRTARCTRTGSARPPISSATTRSASARDGSRSTARAPSSSPASCVSTRDHSWGVRYGVGVPPPDVPEVDALAGLGFQMIWCPLLFERDDGSRYGMLMHFQIVTAPGLGVVHKIVMGGVEHPGRRVRAVARPRARADVRPGEPAAAGRRDPGDDRRRRDPRARGRGARRHRHPARRGPVLRLRRPSPRRMARRAPRRRRAHRRLLARPRTRGGCTRSATP